MWRDDITSAIAEGKKLAIVIGLSAGKDSTATALLFKKTFPELMDQVHFLFADTGSELPETYEYLEKLQTYFGKPIDHLVSRVGKLEDIIKNKFNYFLPSPKSRYCTRMSKIVPFRDKMNELAATHDIVLNLVGIRFDEPDRTGYVPCGEYAMKVFTLFPLKDEKLNLNDVFKMVGDAVGLPAYYSWRTRSGCTYCFYQRRVEWVNLLEKHPDLFEHAKTFEKPEKGYTWIKGMTLDELASKKDEIKARYVKRLKKAVENNKELSLTDGSILERALAEEDEQDMESCSVCR